MRAALMLAALTSAACAHEGTRGERALSALTQMGVGSGISSAGVTGVGLAATLGYLALEENQRLPNGQRDAAATQAAFVIVPVAVVSVGALGLGGILMVGGRTAFVDAIDDNRPAVEAVERSARHHRQQREAEEPTPILVGEPDSPADDAPPQ